MTYQITVEHVVGEKSTREQFRVHCVNDTEAQNEARAIVNSCGMLAAVVDVTIIE